MHITKEDLQEKIITRLHGKSFASKQRFTDEVKKICREYKAPKPRNIDLLISYHSMVDGKKIDSCEKLEEYLVKRTVRTQSGVAPISVLTKPYHCPGKCVFCPTEQGVPKSYLSNEPAVMRAILNQYDPYNQVMTRLKALSMTGHNTDKCEVIVIGGTWSYLPKQYQTWFLKRCLDALNGVTARTLAEAQRINETAKNRQVALCLETRPDYITPKEVARMRKLGCTRVEMGVQTTDEYVLKQNIRGHGMQAVVRATRLLKEAGFKVSYHMMPGLPHATPESDIQSFRDLFTRPEYQPDMIKIYPCVVVEDSQLYEMHKRGEYVPYSDEVLLRTLKEIVKLVPEYARITRLIRDIPTTSIVGGNKIANLRETIEEELAIEGTPAKDIRAREPREKSLDPADLALYVDSYKASGGIEYFLSYTTKDKKTLYGFLRLRINTEYTSELQNLLRDTANAALIREIHVYGKVAPLDQKTGKVQHLGLGKKLIARAEEIARSHALSKIVVISGVGVREYYKTQGYTLGETYMVKNI